MAKKKGAGGKPQPYDKDSGKYVADYAAMGTQELRERQVIEFPESAAHPPVEKAFGFHRLDTKHHQRHAREMGFKNMREYEQAAVAFSTATKESCITARKMEKSIDTINKHVNFALVAVV